MLFLILASYRLGRHVIHLSIMLSLSILLSDTFLSYCGAGLQNCLSRHYSLSCVCVCVWVCVCVCLCLRVRVCMRACVSCPRRFLKALADRHLTKICIRFQNECMNKIKIIYYQNHSVSIWNFFIQITFSRPLTVRSHIYKIFIFLITIFPKYKKSF